MLTHRRIYPALNFFLRHDLVVQGVAHTVKTLELKPVFVITGQFNDHRCAVRIVGSKLRVNRITVVQQAVSTGMVRHVSRGLPCKYRETVHTGLLGHFNFCIPVSAFNQPHHHAAAHFQCQRA